MDFTNQQTLDVALTVVSHLATAGIAYLAAAIRMDRKSTPKVASGASASYASKSITDTPPATPGQVDRRHAVTAAIRAARQEQEEGYGASEFVRFRDESDGPQANDARTAHRSGASANGRNRSEVISLARKMLDAGNSPERVADLLPITAAELAMVTASR